MRRLFFAITAVAGVLLQTGVAVAAPVLHLSGWKASAGKPETFTITRVGGNGAATIMFRTSDGSAIAGPDYAATSQTITWQQRQTTATVQVATFVNPAKAGLNISFTASITANGVTSSATGLIVEPPAPAPTPTPPGPITAWVAAPLTVGGYAKVAASEQSVPKESPYTYGEAIYRTVQAGEVVKLGARLPDVACACVGASREWVVSALDGKFIGYLWENDLRGAAPAP